MVELFRRSKNTIALSTLAYMALRNVMSKKLRSFLTIFGVVIGISAITFLVSFGLGLQVLVQEDVVGDQSLKAIDVSSSNSQIVKLNSDSVTKIQDYSHVEAVGVSYSFSAGVAFGGGESDAIIYGVDQTYQELTTLKLMSGRLLKEDDNNDVVISQATLKAVGISDPEKAVGREVELVIPLDNRSEREKEIRKEFTIIGVIDSESDSELFTPSGVFDAAGVADYDQLKVVVDATENVAGVRTQIESAGLETTSPVDTLEQINQLFRFFNLLLASFGAVGMLVAVLGMFNTLTISLIERTKEIGLMITLGARRLDMRILFLVEALILSIVGAIIGVVFAIFAGEITNMVINRNASERAVDAIDVFSTPLWLVAGLVGFMVAVGLAVVYFPAKRAEKINPIDALRRE